LRFDPLSLWERVRVRADSRATGRAFGNGDALTPALSQRERESDRGPESLLNFKLFEALPSMKWSLFAID
jgi:hypothetical protein